MSEINLVDLLSAADLTNESVAFYPADAEGAIIVDCYRSGAGEPCSVLVQGSDMTVSLRNCFRLK